MKRLMCLFTVYTLLMTASPVVANNVMEPFDPCIKARDDFSKNRRQAMAHIDEQIAKQRSISDEDSMTIWLDNAREELRKVFTTKVLPVRARAIELSGGTVDPEVLFTDWVANEVLKSAELRKEVIAQYRTALDQQLAVEKAKIVKAFDEGKDELNKNCPMAFGDQAVRVVLTTTLAPVNIVVGNFKAAEDEPGFGAKVLRATTGISAADIGKYGILGGEHSEANIIVKGAEKAVQDVGKAAEKAVQDAGKAVEKAVQDVGKAFGIKW